MKKKKKHPKHINCRGGLTQPGKCCQNVSIAKAAPQSDKTYTDVKAYQAQRHPHLSHKRSIIETLQQPGSQHGQSRSIKWRGYQCRRYRHSTHQDHGNIFTQKIQMLIKSMRIPTFHHKSPMKHRHHTNGEEWTAAKQETLQP